MLPQEKMEEERAQKRELMEEVLIAKLLHKMPNKTPIEVGNIVFRTKDPYAFQELEVVKVDQDKAEVFPQGELYEERAVTSALSFRLEELWDGSDYFAVLEQVAKMSDLELEAKISQSNPEN